MAKSVVATTSASPLQKRYVFTMNANRDAYQVPLALAEVDALECFVTEYYTPDWLMQLAGGRSRALRRRHHAQIPARLTRSAIGAFLYDAAARVFNMTGDAHWRHVDSQLSKLTCDVAKRNPDAGLLSYHNYAIHSFPYLSNRPKIIFQYHPHPDYLLSLFVDDYAKHPEVAWSFEKTRDTRPHPQENLNEWNLADAFICASGVTKRSLLHAGCTKPIHIVPYGITPGFVFGDTTQEKDRERCRFLFVGQGLQRKGLHHLLHAWKAARLEHAVLDVVSRRMDPGIANLLPIPNVNLLEDLSLQELRDAFARSHVFVMPSLVEGFGLVYLEALAGGCYCLGTQNTGLPDLELDDDKVGYVEPANVEALTDELRALEARWREGGWDHAAISKAALSFTYDRFRAGVRRAIGEIEHDCG